MNIIDDLKWRGAINQQTDEAGLKELTENQSVSLYCGIDPTGAFDSFHDSQTIPIGWSSSLRCSWWWDGCYR